MEKKTVLTLGNLKSKAEMEFQKIQQDKSLWQKFKGALGSNETMFGYYDKALDYRNFLSLENDFFKKLDIYEEILFSSYLAKYLENIKYEKLGKFLDINEKEYLAMIKNYIEKEINENLFPDFGILNEGFLVLKEREFEDFSIVEKKIKSLEERSQIFEEFKKEVTLFLKNFSDDIEMTILEKYRKLSAYKNERLSDYLKQYLEKKYSDFVKEMKEKIARNELSSVKKIEEIIIINEKYCKVFSFFKHFDDIEIRDEFLEDKNKIDSYKKILKLALSIQKDYDELVSGENDSFKLIKIGNIHNYISVIDFRDLLAYEDVKNISNEIKAIKEKINYIFEEVYEKLTAHIYEKRDKILNEISDSEFLLDKSIFTDINSLKQKYIDSSIFINRLDNFSQNFIEKLIDEFMEIMENTSSRISFSEFQKNILSGFKCIDEFSEKDSKYEIFYKKIDKIKRDNFIFSQKYDLLIEKLSDVKKYFIDIVILKNYLEFYYEKKEINIFYENKERMKILKEKWLPISESYKNILEDKELFAAFTLEFKNSRTSFYIIPYDVVSIGKMEGNTIVIKSLNISGEHLLMDFNLEKIINLGKNGTFVNKDGDKSIEEFGINNIEEFNLAKTFTFSIKKYGDTYWGFRLKALTNKNLRFFEEDQEDLLQKLKNTYFIKLKQDKSIFIDRENMTISCKKTDETCIEICFSESKILISDESMGLKNIPLMKELNSFFDNYKISFE